MARPGDQQDGELIEDVTELVTRGGGQIAFEYRGPFDEQWYRTRGTVAVRPNGTLTYTDRETGAVIPGWPSPEYQYAAVRYVGGLIGVAGEAMREGAERLFGEAAVALRVGADQLYDQAGVAVRQGTQQLVDSAGAAIHQGTARLTSEAVMALQTGAAQMYNETGTAVREGVGHLVASAAAGIVSTSQNAAAAATAGIQRTRSSAISGINDVAAKAAEALAETAARLEAEQRQRERRISLERDMAAKEHDAQRQALEQEKTRVATLHQSRQQVLDQDAALLEQEKLELEKMRRAVAAAARNERTQLEQALALKEAVLAEHQRAIDRAQKSMDELTAEFAARNEDIARREQLLAAKENQSVDRLNKEREALEAQRTEWAAVLDAQRRQLADRERHLADRMDESQREFDRQQSRLRARERELRQFEQMLDSNGPSQRPRNPALHAIPVSSGDESGYGGRNLPPPPARRFPTSHPEPMTRHPVIPNVPQAPMPTMSVKQPMPPQGLVPALENAEVDDDEAAEILGVSTEALRKKMTAAAASAAFAPRDTGELPVTDVANWDTLMERWGTETLILRLRAKFALPDLPRGALQHADAQRFAVLENLIRGAPSHGGFASSPYHFNQAVSMVVDLIVALGARQGKDAAHIRKTLAGTHMDPADVIIANAPRSTPSTRFQRGPKPTQRRAQDDRMKKITCHGCNEKGHYLRDCPKSAGGVVPKK